MIFLTGSHGFIGGHLRKILFPTVDYDLKLGKDINNYDLLVHDMQGCDTVIHLAAFTSVEESYLLPDAYYINNIIGSANVIIASSFTRTRKFIFASSAAVYDKNLSPYGRSKLVGEEMLKHLSTNWVALRLFNVYGEGSKSVVDKFKHLNEVDIYGDGEQTRDFISVNEVCAVIKHFTSLDSLPSSALDVGTGRAVSINSLAQGKKINYLPAKQELRNSVADIGKLKFYLARMGNNGYEPDSISN